ncbi:MAG: DNA adenine methylase [Chloroflexi bacterium]|nr:DNA adenine methylase [Chloroflexota bacterium]
MVQLQLPAIGEQHRVVNVASVPQRSPFRYPGGKTWFVPLVRQWLAQKQRPAKEFLEPFAGGGIVGLTVAFEAWASKVVLAELDDQVAAVWKAILGDSAEWLANKITSFDVSFESVRSVLDTEYADPKEKAFQTLLKNRVNHGGILAPGSGVIKSGENGKGIKSRWYPATLRKRILDIAAIKDRIDFIEGDGVPLLRQKATQEDAIFFIDPPYTAGGKKAGKRLYRYNDLNHEELFNVVETLRGDFLMTYDNTLEAQRLAQDHRFDIEVIPMKNTHNVQMTELLIGRDLQWARGAQ